MAYDSVPVETKDPSGLARELGWRARRELGENAGVVVGGIAAVEGKAALPKAAASRARNQPARTPRSRIDAFEHP